MVVVCHVVDDECNGGRVSCCTRRVQLSCVMLYTSNIVVVCHAVDAECSGGRMSSCTPTSTVVVMCHVVHDEYSCRVSRCTRLI